MISKDTDVASKILRVIVGQISVQDKTKTGNYSNERDPDAELVGHSTHNAIIRGENVYLLAFIKAVRTARHLIWYPL